MAYTREQVIILSAVAPVLLASGVAAYRFRHLPQTGRVLTALVWFALATEVVSRVCWFLKINNLFLWPIYMSVEFALLVWLYSLVTPPYRKYATVAIGLFMAGVLTEFVWRSNQPLVISNLARSAESVMIIALALRHAYRSFREPVAGELWRQPMLWVSLGLLVFFSANFFIYLFINYALNYSQQLNFHIWATHAGLNLVLYAAYAYALWISPPK
ncbi:hypothetical protein [Hymenobacter koreensis]|uniref:CPBP family intramembrane metalloprotease n=1 Tax=Hymenobacter koreensis TaxID=1084523 RepID=A0ABP8J8H6_9BACT